MQSHERKNSRKTKKDEGNTQDKKSKHPQVFETVCQDFDGLSRVFFKCSHYIVVYWHDRFKSIIIRGPYSMISKDIGSPRGHGASPLLLQMQNKRRLWH